MEFQELKLDVFKVLVEKYHVRAFALEGDYGGCEQVNRYIHGGKGTAKEAAGGIGFDIYRTKEMEELISYMRTYNETAEVGEDLRFYGFDMQSYAKSYQFLVEACKQAGVDTAELEKLMDGNSWSKAYDVSEQKEIITSIKEELQNKENTAQGVHLADVLLQNDKLGEVLQNQADYVIQRDLMMKENVLWIAKQEKERGCQKIFISGHNDHIAKQAGIKECWLDFKQIPKGTELAEQISQPMYMGSLGEGYAFYMRLYPSSYRKYRTPEKTYDGMSFVPEATPIEIR